MEPIRVCVVAAFEPLRRGLAGSLRSSADMTVVGEASSLEQLIGSETFRDADVVVMDAATGEDVPARDAYARINEWLPALRILFLGSRDAGRSIDADDLPLYMRLNTVGFLVKDGPTARLLDAVRLIAGGAFVCETDVIRHILTRLTHWATEGEDTRGG